MAFARLILWALRGVFLLAGGLLVWLRAGDRLPLRGRRGGHRPLGIESTRAGIEPLHAEDVAGIASADSVPDRLTLRLLDASGEVLHARSGSARRRRLDAVPSRRT